VKEQDALFEMHIDGEIDSSEYIKRKEKFTEAKQKIEQLIADNNYRFHAWLNNAKNLFSFAETAEKRFESGNLFVKREILASLGSNLILLDRKLNIQLQEPPSVFTKYSSELKALRNRLEPIQDTPEQEVMAVISSGNEIWGPLLDEVRTCLMKVA
tara:strand:+ start:494 stop:961 length:468 start_codon:yes stop_codon:yes gene_type:complete